jgi:unsaturated rhamnogalacturonyl hydrolase
MTRNPNPDTLSWNYSNALFLYGQYQVYLRTHDTRLLQYLKDWGERHVNADGKPYFFGVLSKPVDLTYALDYQLAGRLMLILYRETGTAKYKLAADRISQVWAAWPRTSDGGFWHANPLRPWQLWVDGGYMLAPFMVEYQTAFGEPATIGNEATKELTVLANHLWNSSTGLLYHGYDESGQQTWADPINHRSGEFWCRGNGWYAMALVDVLDRLPLTHPDRPQLLTVLNGLAAAFQRYQDPTTRRWFQVVDKGSLTTNWVETSGSAMFAYALARAVERGYVPLSFQETASLGYQGVMNTVSLGTDGLTNLVETVTGGVPATLSGYLSRPRATNDWHGLGAFLIMHEQFNKRPDGATFKWLEAESASFTAPLVIVRDSRASGGAAILAPFGTNSTAAVPDRGRASFTFTLAKAGNYRIWGRALTTSTNRDSFWIRVNGGAWQVWNGFAIGSNWFWEDVNKPAAVREPSTFALNAGAQTIDVAYREGGGRLDRLLITDVPTYVPAGFGG